MSRLSFLGPWLATAGALIALWCAWDWWRFADSPVNRLPSGSGPAWVRLVPGIYTAEAAALALLAALLWFRGLRARRQGAASPDEPRPLPTVVWMASGAVSAVAGFGLFSLGRGLVPAAALLTLACLVVPRRRLRGLLLWLLGAFLQAVAMLLVSTAWSG